MVAVSDFVGEHGHCRGTQRDALRGRASFMKADRSFGDLLFDVELSNDGGDSGLLALPSFDIVTSTTRWCARHCCCTIFNGRASWPIAV